MPKAKLFKQVRLTKAPTSRSRKKEDGRPKGTYKRYKFEETKLGFILKYEVPVVYDIIMSMTPDVPFPEPSLLVIQTVCKASKDPSLRKAKFKRYLDEYQKRGIYCGRAKRISKKSELYYKRIRDKSLNRYIEKTFACFNECKV